MQQTQQHVRSTVKTHLLNASTSVNQMTEFVSKERGSLSETLRHPKAISNQKYDSREKNQNGTDVNKDTNTECIVPYIKKMTVTSNLSSLIIEETTVDTTFEIYFS